MSLCGTPAQSVSEAFAQSRLAYASASLGPYEFEGDFSTEKSQNRTPNRHAANRPGCFHLLEITAKGRFLAIQLQMSAGTELAQLPV